MEYQEVEKKIGYTFKNRELLDRAFTHSSFANENRDAADYERLEFLGDATLGFVMGLYLFETYPDYKEGALSKLRAGIVDQKTISEVVDELDIIQYMRTGAGKASENVSVSVKTKCDLFEAIVGAILLDNDKDIAHPRTFILRYLKDKTNLRHVDYKSKLYEICIRNNQKVEFLELEKKSFNNTAHFIVALNIDGVKVAEGEGSNKKSAEQDASQNFLSKFSDFH